MCSVSLTSIRTVSPKSIRERVVVAVVTGAGGFIGRHLVATLALREPVLGIDRRAVPAPPGATALTADLLDADPAVRAALAQARVVYHLAGSPDVRDPRPDAAQHRYRDNVLTTAAVLAAVPPDTPLLVTSSSSVYGGSRQVRSALARSVRAQPSAETDPLRPRGGYAQSKFLVERLCAGRAEAGGLVTVLRPFTVAGEGQRAGMALARWIEAARRGEPLTLLGSPHRSRDITDVRQVVHVLIDLADRRTTGVLNIGTGVGHTLQELAEAVCAAAGVAVRTELAPAHPAEVTHTLADTRALRRAIGWVPRTDLADLIARQIAAVPAEPQPESVSAAP
ncbi:MAG TPA: NAD(P)-dependent oxidoreductase [Pseudonocardiaceae bacterium]|nr:NAD(P)-dependent oxidoreductase [Pseudonocardiaceae bacterium]